MSEELKPTIENPFADREPKSKSTVYASTEANSNANKRNVARPVIRNRTFAGPAPSIIEQEPLQAKDYDPGFYVSAASKRFVTSEIDAGRVTAEELPVVYEIALYISNIFNRPLPSLSDVEVAVKMRNVQNVKDIAEGRETLDVLRKEIGPGEVIPKAERIKLWKKVSEVVMEKWTEKHGATE